RWSVRDTLAPAAAVLLSGPKGQRWTQRCGKPERSACGGSPTRSDLSTVAAVHLPPLRLLAPYSPCSLLHRSEHSPFLAKIQPQALGSSHRNFDGVSRSAYPYVRLDPGTLFRP